MRLYLIIVSGDCQINKICPERYMLLIWDYQISRIHPLGIINMCRTPACLLHSENLDLQVEPSGKAWGINPVIVIHYLSA